MSIDTKDNNYLKGLNTFRFFAAFLVIMSHGHLSLIKLKIITGFPFPILARGRDGVEFFFVLSGFLITYLLSLEIKKTGNVSIKGFYMRRVFRIWPLYFIVLTIGFILLCIIYPLLYHKPFFAFPSWKWLTLFILFLPNLATKLYPMGMLNPLWSIGVEEQFYLFWAPFVKFFRNRIAIGIFLFILITSLWQLILERNLFNFPDLWVGFFKFQKFYAMSIGSFFGYQFFKLREIGYKPPSHQPVAQVVVLCLIIIHLFFVLPFSEDFIYRFFLSILFGLLIFTTVSSTDSGAYLNFERVPFIYLGQISYGLYMYHMMIDYFLRIIFIKLNLIYLNSYLVLGLYLTALFLLTIFVSAISFKYVESYFLRLKSKFS